MRVTERAYGRLVDGIYDAALGHIAWPAVLEEVSKATNSEDACFQVWGFGGEFPQLMVNENWFVPESVMTEYADNVADDPRVVYVSENLSSISGVINDYAFIREREMRHHPYYDYLSKASGVRYFCGTMTTPSANIVNAVTLQRTPHQGVGDIEVEKALISLRRHFLRAFEIMSAVDQGDNCQRVASGLLELSQHPTLVVTGSLRVSDLNESAERFLRSSNDLKLVSGHLKARDAGAQSQLLRAVASCVSPNADTSRGGQVLIRRGLGARVLVEIIPLSISETGMHEPLVCLIVKSSEVEDGPISDQQIATLFRLTPAEVRLVISLADGLNLRECADQMGVGYETVRTHLKNATSKVGVRSQSQLVSRVLQLR